MNELTVAPSRSYREWVGFRTIITREFGRIIRIWGQTLVPSAVTTTLYFVIFGSLVGRRIGAMGGFDYIAYIAPGLIMMSVITNSYGNVVSSFFGAKFQRFLEEIMVSPLPNWVIVAGYVGGGMVRGLLVGGVVTVVSFLFTNLHVHHAFAIVAAVLPAFAGLVLAGADCDLVSVILYDADREFVTHAGSFPGVLDPWTDRRPGAMYGTQIMQGYPEGLEYVTAGNQSEGVLSLARNGIGRAWTVPLIVAGETYGTMTAGRRGIEPFEAGVLETLRACGHVLARVAREEALVATAAYDQARSQLLELLAGAPGESALDDLLRDALPALGAAIPFDALVAVALDENGRPLALAAEPPGALHEAVAWDALESAGPAAQAPVERAVAEMRGPFVPLT